MANTYRMTNTQGEVRHVRSSRFDGHPEYPRLVRPDPSDNADFSVRNAAEFFAYRSRYPVLVVDETDGDRFVGIYAAPQSHRHGVALPQPPRGSGDERPEGWPATTEELKVAEWWEWAGGHALSEALIWTPYEGEDRAFREAKNRENHHKAIIRRYDRLRRGAQIREGRALPDLTPTLTEARDAARRSREALGVAA